MYSYTNTSLSQEDNELIQLVLMLPSDVIEGKSKYLLFADFKFYLNFHRQLERKSDLVTETER